MTAPIASGWSDAGWDLRPLESAAFARRTPQADIPQRKDPGCGFRPSRRQGKITGQLIDAVICGARLATTTDDDLPVDTLILLAQCAIRR